MKLDAPINRRMACMSLPALIGAGNLEAATSCFARDACLLTQDATAIHDRVHIRPLLAQLISRRARIEVAQRSLLYAGDVALARERWTIEIDAAEGSRFEQVCNPTLVLRQIEEQWKLALLAPWGWATEAAER